MSTDLDIAGFRAAWESQVRGRVASSTRPLDVSAYPGSSPQIPCVFLQRGVINYHGTMGVVGLTQSEWEMVLRVGGGADADAHAAMDDYCATSTDCSLPQAVEHDPTLGGVVGSLNVMSVSAPVWFGDEQGRTWLEARFAMKLVKGSA